jgi:hypothetical protein
MIVPVEMTIPVEMTVREVAVSPLKTVVDGATAGRPFKPE